jgi:hypothetical protein
VIPLLKDVHRGLYNRVLEIDRLVVVTTKHATIAVGTTTVAAILVHAGYHVLEQGVGPKWCLGNSMPLKQLPPGALFGYVRRQCAPTIVPAAVGAATSGSTAMAADGVSGVPPPMPTLDHAPPPAVQLSPLSASPSQSAVGAASEALSEVSNDDLGELPDTDEVDDYYRDHPSRAASPTASQVEASASGFLQEEPSEMSVEDAAPARSDADAAPHGKRSASDPPEADRAVAPGDAVGERALEQARGMVRDLEAKMGALRIEASLCPAAARGDTGAMRELLVSGVPVDTPDASKYTPLMFAAAAGQVDAVAFLLERNADIMVQVESESPLTCAIRGQHVNVVRALLQHSISNESLSRQLRNLFDTPSSQAAAMGALSALREDSLVNIMGEHQELPGVLVNMHESFKDSLGQTDSDHRDVTRATTSVNGYIAVLLRATAAPSMLNALLCTAAKGGVVDQVKLLLDAGADRWAKDRCGHPVFMSILELLLYECLRAMDMDVYINTADPLLMDRHFAVLALLLPDSDSDLKDIVFDAANGADSPGAYFRKIAERVPAVRQVKPLL